MEGSGAVPKNCTKESFLMATEVSGRVTKVRPDVGHRGFAAVGSCHGKLLRGQPLRG